MNYDGALEFAAVVVIYVFLPAIVWLVIAWNERAEP